MYYGDRGGGYGGQGQDQGLKRFLDKEKTH